jgi:predicted nucleic-acid-binding Zn-ribbon protein
MTTLWIVIAVIIIAAVIFFWPHIFKETCSHQWGPVLNGYQYCIKCNIARTVPIPPCQHEWAEERKSKIFRTNRLVHPPEQNEIGTETIYVCTKCTARKYVRTEINTEPISKFI